MKNKITSKLFFPVLAATLLLSGCGGGSLRSHAMPATSNKTARRIHQILPTYADAAHKHWPHIYPALPLMYGSHDSTIPIIRERLIFLKDLPSHYRSDSTYFDSPMRGAVAQFQWRHGLKSTGKIGKKTLAALNVSPAQRYRELVESMYKWAELPENVGSHYIHVNVPNFRMNLVRDGNSVMSMKVIAGKKSRPTPTLYSKVKTIVFNPPWNVPPTIVSKDVIPGMRKDPNYLKEHYDIKVYADWKPNAAEIDPLTIDWESATGKNLTYRLTAPPSDINPLGRVKFIFENDHDIYMHDTPSKGLFNKIERAYSSGCIRLEKPFHLVEYFYEDNQDLDYMQVNEYLSTYNTKYVKLKNPIPVYVTYITAWVDVHGMPHFREDIYRNESELHKLPQV